MKEKSLLSEAVDTGFTLYILAVIFCWFFNSAVGFTVLWWILGYFGSSIIVNLFCIQFGLLRTDADSATINYICLGLATLSGLYGLVWCIRTKREINEMCQVKQPAEPQPQPKFIHKEFDGCYRTVPKESLAYRKKAPKNYCQE